MRVQGNRHSHSLMWANQRSFFEEQFGNTCQSKESILSLWLCDCPFVTAPYGYMNSVCKNLFRADIPLLHGLQLPCDLNNLNVCQ